MNDFDSDRDLEADVRAELRRTIVPPAAPQYLRARVEEMAEQLSTGPGRRPSFRLWIGRGALVLRLAATALILVVVAATFVSMSRSSSAGPGSGSAPMIGPARAVDPAVTPGPTFPLRTASTGSAAVDLLAVTADGGVFVYAKDEGMRVSLDSGVTWSEARQMPYKAGFYQGDFVDGEHGWVPTTTQGTATPDVTVYRTSDGGRTWQPAQIGSVTLGANEFANATVHFLDTSHGQLWARLSDGGISGTERCEMSITDDGGATWSKLYPSSCIGMFQPPTWISNAVGYALTGDPAGDPVSASDPRLGDMKTWVTLDGGRTWKIASIPMDPSEVGYDTTTLVAAPGRLRLFVEFVPKKGSDWPPRAAVYESTDDGATWSQAYSIRVPDQLRALSTSGFDDWVAQMDNSAPGVTQGQLVETLDGGRTWNALPGPGFSNVTDMRWWDDQRGVVDVYIPAPCQSNASGAGRSGEPQVQQTSPDTCSGHSTLFVTNDGGRTWHQVPF